MTGAAERRRIGWLLLGTVAGLLLVVATLVIGPLVAAMAAAGIAVVVLLSHPRAAVAVLVVAGLGLDANTGAQFGQDRAWTPVVGVTPLELLLGVAVAAVAVDVVRTGRAPRGLGPFTAPAGVYALAVLLSAVTGWYAGSAPLAAIDPARNIALTFVVALLVVHVLRTREDLERGAAVMVGLAVAKLASGLLLLGAGRGTGAPSGRGVAAAGSGSGVTGGGLPFYEGATAMLAIALLVAIPAHASFVRRVSGRAVLVWGLAATALILSLRRGWWLGTAAAVAVVTAVLAGRHGRSLLAPAVVLVVGLTTLGAVGIVPVELDELDRGGSGVVSQRIQSLRPSAVGSNAFDRYREGEARNVLAALERSPVVGLGAGQGWPQRYGLSVYLGAELDTYVHSSYLYHWMVMGLAGLVAYVWLLYAMLVAGWRLARDARATPVLRTVGAVVLALAVANAVASASQAQMGADARVGLAIGVAMGACLTAIRLARRGDEPSSTLEPAPAVRLRQGGPTA